MENTENMVVYTMINKETGETSEMLTHTVRDGFVDFANVSAVSDGIWTDPTYLLVTFANDNGVLTNDIYTIEVKGEPLQLLANNPVAEVVPVAEVLADEAPVSAEDVIA